MVTKRTLASENKYTNNTSARAGRDIAKKGTPQMAARNKAIVLDYRKKGIPVARAIEDLGLHYKTYEYWRKTDANFREQMDLLKHIATNPGEGKAEGMPSFEDFCMKYLDTQLSLTTSSGSTCLRIGNQGTCIPTRLTTRVSLRSSSSTLLPSMRRVRRSRSTM